MRETPLIKAAKTTNAGNKSGQSVASNSKARLSFPEIVIPFESFKTEHPAETKACKIALSACKLFIDNPFTLISAPSADATNQNDAALQSLSMV